MINCKRFYDCLLENEIDFFSGVPDSLLKDFCAYVTDNTEGKRNIIAANEGNAIAITSGYHLATGKYGLVYMQNSGLGNAINPLTSLCDPEVYSIPTLLLIGWRGEPGKKDEPQHVKMGTVTLKILDSIGVPYRILDTDFEPIILEAREYMKNNRAPYAIIVPNKMFESYKLQSNKETNYELSREDAIRLIVPLLDESDIAVFTTGKISRELFELRESQKQSHEKDFLTVGCMGHSSSIALGIAIEKPERKVYCFDGDGALIMHMGALSTISSLHPKNFRHLIFNNFAHDSVGGQPTAASYIDISLIAKASGYSHAVSAKTKDEVRAAMEKMKKMQGPILLEIKISKGAREDLGRPTRSPIENKEDFMKFLNR